MRRPSPYRLLMLGAIVLVLLNAWVATRALVSLFTAQQWLQHTLQVLTETEAVSLNMSLADSAARAYMLTGDPVFDERYNHAASEVLAAVDRVRMLTADNQSQRKRVEVLRSRIRVKLGALDAALSMKRGHPGSLQIEPGVLGPALSDSPDGGISVRSALIQMQSEEGRLHEARLQTEKQARRNVVATFAGAILLDLVLVFVAFQQLIQARLDQAQLSARAAEIAALNAELQSLNTELEARVQQRTTELEISNRELEAFSYSVSHDLRAPLRTIDGFSLALAEDFADLLNAEGRDYIQRVRGGVQRMGTLIDALLQLSRVTRSDVRRERVDLSQIATLVFNELVGSEAGRKPTFNAEPGIFADADPGLIRVAFENLIGNAVKFTSKIAEPQIQFGQTVRNEETVYFIRDNGAGFDMQYVDRLFTAFQRLHGDRDFKGSGIGLATVSRIVRRHHGTIWAEGEIGRGATFYFTLSAFVPKDEISKPAPEQYSNE